MVKRVYIAAVNLILISALFFSCVKEGMEGYADNPDEIKIVGTKGENISRSIPPNTNFAEDISYRLWAYNNATGDYIFNDTITRHGIVANESYGHYIEMDVANRSRLVDNFTIYGLTDNETSDENAFTPNDGTTGYTFSIDNSKVIPSDTGSVNRQLTDYYRGEFEYVRDNMPIDSKGLIVMNFKHIMSQLKISILQQPDENTGDIYDDLKVTKIELEGDYSSMDYDVKTGVFSNPTEYGDEGLRTLWEWDDTITDANNTDANNKITKDVKYFVTSTVFPTLSAGREYNLYLTLDGVDAQKFNLENGKVKIKLTDSGLGETNLNFEQNYSYHIQVFFMSGNVHVIAIRPEVYPWLDGETDKGEQGDMYEEVSLGNTLLFDNLVWADRNLGATEFSPVDEASFKNCTGFYYQFQRNIPYFPKTLKEGELVYPVTSDTEVNEQSFSDKGKNFIQKVENIEQYISWGWYAGFAVYTSGQGLPGTLNWAGDISEQPVPPGWRIPSADEFLSIMPSCPAAGNITFLSSVNNNNGDFGNNSPSTLQESVISLKVPYDNSYDYEPNNYTNVNGVSGDPSFGYSTVYVISKSNNELDNVSKPINKKTKRPGYNDPYWGTIYAIKKVGTDEAYRIRWHIIRPIEGIDNYVLVISKYTASEDDKLLFRDSDKNNKYHYRNYDWDNPSAVMYIPIVGMIGSHAEWSKGSVGNFGTETIILTTDKVDDFSNKNNYFKTLRIKIAGDNAVNQYIFVSQDYGGSGGQLRLVRDITN